MKKEKLRAKDIVKMYSIGLSTVWLYAKQKKITKIKVSDRVTVFDKDEIDRFFQNNEKYK